MRRSPYCGVVLAAGGSRRFGGRIPKQIVEIEGEPVVRRVARIALASRLDRVIVVVGYEAAAVRRAVGDLPVEVVENPRWEDGQSGSVKAGLVAVPPDARGVVFMPCDQPFLTGPLIDGLLAEHEANGGAIVVPVHRGRRGSPVLIDRSLFTELEGITGDKGARQLFAGHRPRELPVARGEPLLDFDTPEELERLVETRRSAEEGG